MHAVQTPEGIELHLPLAGIVPRAAAWLIDVLIRSGIYLVLGLLLMLLGNTGMGLFLIATFTVEWFYPVLFEVLRDGQTPGKRAYDIRVIHDDGTPIGWSASLIRNLLRVVDFLPLAYGFGLLSLMLNRDFKRLGDLAAGSLVIHVQSVANAPALPDVPPVRPDWPLSLEEQQAIIAFAQRSRTLTEERARELALLTVPLVDPARQPVATLQGMANWLMGKRPDHDKQAGA